VSEHREPTEIELSMMAQSLGRKGGLKGGKARARKMTARELSEASRHAALARWSKKDLRKALSEMTLEELIADQERDQRFGDRVPPRHLSIDRGNIKGIS
jgi:hypothetical protein